MLQSQEFINKCVYANTIAKTIEVNPKTPINEIVIGESQLELPYLDEKLEKTEGKIEEVTKYLETQLLKKRMNLNGLDKIIDIEFEKTTLTKDELKDLLMEQQEQM